MIPALLPVLLAGAVAAAPSPVCKEYTSGECWIELVNHPDCYAWLADFPPARWQLAWEIGGTCTDGLASGSGTLSWMVKVEGTGRVLRSFGSGEMRAGKMHGFWTFTHIDNGDRVDCTFVDGEAEECSRRPRQ